MRSGRKKPNTRNRRRNVLDVKLRSDHVRALRARGLAVMIGVLFGTVFTCYVVWRTGEWALDRLIYQNKAFEIRHIQVSTDGQIAVDYLQRWSGARIGQNLMELDLEALKANLELLPNIESLAVERVLPSTLRIRVVEREPIARVILPRLDEQGRGLLQVWLLAADGTVMMPVDPKYCTSKEAPATGRLPALTGVRPTELRLGRAVEATRVHAALSFLQCFNRSGMGARVQLSAVELNQSGVLVATTTDGARVTLALEKYERQLARWRQIHEQGIRLGKRIQTLDLAVQNNVPVRWVDADKAVGSAAT